MREKQDLMNSKKLLLENMSRKKTYDLSLKEFLDFREDLYDIYKYVFDNTSASNYEVMPLKTDKTIAYYIYHLNRIEDITLHTLILDEEQIFHSEEFQEKLQINISTTGNELDKDQIIDFSKQINIDELKNYVELVYKKTNTIIAKMTYDDIKIKVSKERKENLINLESVSREENAFWLVDYWCNKDYLGLIKMPFISHHFHHLWGCIRILNKISANSKK